MATVKLLIFTTLVTLLTTNCSARLLVYYSPDYISKPAVAQPAQFMPSLQIMPYISYRPPLPYAIVNPFDINVPQIELRHHHNKKSNRISQEAQSTTYSNQDYQPIYATQSNLDYQPNYANQGNLDYHPKYATQSEYNDEDALFDYRYQDI